MCVEKNVRFAPPGSETPPKEIAEDLEDELDLLPEYYTYKDEGCALAPACLECPFPRCVYDSDHPWGRDKTANVIRDQEIIRLHRDEKIKTDELASRFGLTVRKVQRILKKEHP